MGRKDLAPGKEKAKEKKATVKRKRLGFFWKQVCRNNYQT
jgi:hypothetical protein